MLTKSLCGPPAALFPIFLAAVQLVAALHCRAVVGDEQWDSAAGSQGVGSGLISVIAGQGANLYVGGFFTSIGCTAAANIAHWDGTRWRALGSGIRGSSQNVLFSRVTALAVHGTDLYVGGAFSSGGGVPVTNIARWDGSTWSALGPGVGNYSVSKSSADPSTHGWTFLQTTQELKEMPLFTAGSNHMHPAGSVGAMTIPSYSKPLWKAASAS